MSKVQSNVISSDPDNQILTPAGNIESLVTPMGNVDENQPGTTKEADGRQSVSMQQSRTKPFSRGRDNDKSPNILSSQLPVAQETHHLQEKIHQNHQYMSS